MIPTRIDWEAFSLSEGQGWAQIALLLLAIVLCALIGMERELRNKAAGLRTHTLVGLGSALFMMVSKYGFGDVLEPNLIILDPSRVAAQIVSGIGFIGGGVIFVRRDLVRGLTTAAVVWLAAAIGMACGAGLPILAVTVTAGHFIVVYGLLRVGRRLPPSRMAPSELRITYTDDDQGALRRALEVCAERGFAVAEVNIEWTFSLERAGLPAEPGRDDRRSRGDPEEDGGQRAATVALRLHGDGSVADLAAELGELPGILKVSAGTPDYPSE
ncbi:MAG: MgtC/SapB family protein [Streptosporangiales bacterium]|nr:MgtC/SapB family protein [Streptosporangiales bacterium]